MTTKNQKPASIQKAINEQKKEVSALSKALADLKHALNPFDLSKGSTILPSNKPL